MSKVTARSALRNVRSRLPALGMGVALAAWLAWQGVWAALLMLLPLLWLALARPDPQGSGASRLLPAVLPLWSNQLETLQTQMRTGLDGVLESFGRMVGLCEALDAELGRTGGGDQGALRSLSQQISTQCDTALHGLQFGDRVHQMLDVVKNDQRRLEASIDTLSAMDDHAVQAWLDALRASYTTDEQHQTHRGEAADTGQTSVDYF